MGILTGFRDDLSVYREGLLAQGFWALQIYRFGHARLRYRAKLIRVPWYAAHLVLLKMSEMLFGISIGAPAVIGRRLNIEHFGGIVVHGNTVIGDDCMIRQGVTLGNRHMDRPLEAPILGNRVNVGAGAKILGSVRIGDDVSIGANAVVLCDIPAGCAAVGIPAKVIRRRNDEAEGFGYDAAA
jgi:serine O-acetyltransferase